MVSAEARTHLLRMGDTLFVFTNDDAGMHEPERFGELLDFLAEQDVPATFFVVPAAGGRSLAERPDWLALLDRALAAGHDLQLHGLTHGSAFEFGVPPRFVLDIMPKQKAQWEREPGTLAAHHGYAELSDKLARGREILVETLGCIPRGFRSPCLSSCDNLYRALRDLGFQWSSNQAINPVGWRYIQRDYDSRLPLHPGVLPRPHRLPSGLIEAPLYSEYSWYLGETDVDRQFQLARRDFERARAAGDPFIPLSHYFAMTGRWSAGLRVYERLFDHARTVGHVRFLTLSRLIAEQELP